MNIPVMLKDGKERSVGKNELQSLLSAEQLICFDRDSGCVFIGYDEIRGLDEPYAGEERRTDQVQKLL